MDDDDPRHQMALCRYQAISAYLALDPPRGKRGALLRELAKKTWPGPDGAPMKVQAETLRSWVRRYRREGLRGLMDKPRARRGVQALSPEQVELVLALKREVPERSLDRLIHIAEQTSLIEPGVLRRSTLHRVLQREGLSRRPVSASDKKDLDRFEALAPNDLWQSDMRTGPWLPDPLRPGKVRRTKLFSFLDDHSRKLLHGRFAFAEGLPELELVLRRCLQKYGKPKRVYYDNGKVYRAGHMRHIVATLGIHAIVFTATYRPEGHGKIEAFNRLAKSAFIAEVKASKIRTLEQLNEAFVAWMDLEYNRRTHGETGQTPDERWRAGIDRVEYLDERLLRLAFRWKERRTPDKAGLFSLFGTRYQVGPELARRRVDVYFDPEDLAEVEVHHDGRFVERCVPFEVRPHRRPRPTTPEPAAPSSDAPAPVANWLGHLVERRREEGFVDAVSDHDVERDRADDEIVELLREHLAPDVFVEKTVRDFLRRYGPFDPARAGAALYDVLGDGRADHHVSVYLEAIREALR
ncbi:MAG: Mu transposase C-terminal domain-containing protein [Thermoanaerobaculia bacterium]|nr:Mu transposase C-terminal domain-containing protein [Thermoanaerobaculia bacterium]